jgi:hypothetical protein
MKNTFGITYLSLGYLDELLTKDHSSNNNVKLGFVDTESGNTKKYSKTPSISGQP